MLQQVAHYIRSFVGHLSSFGNFFAGPRLEQLHRAYEGQCLNNREHPWDMEKQPNSYNSFLDIVQDGSGYVRRCAFNEACRGTKCQRAHHIVAVMYTQIIDDCCLSHEGIYACE